MRTWCTGPLLPFLYFSAYSAFADRIEQRHRTAAPGPQNNDMRILHRNSEAQLRIDQLKRATDRIQREIEEVTEREHELRNVGSIKTISHELVDSKVRRMPPALQASSCPRLKRTTSTPQILDPTPLTPPSTPLSPKMTNGVISTTRTSPTPLRFASSPCQKGLMHRFLATRGKMHKTGPGDGLPTITLNPESIRAFNRSLEIRGLERNEESRTPPTRKGYVPVEKKIQKELNEMRERENELRLMRSQMLAKSQPNLADIGNDSGSDIYDSAGSMRSGTSTNTVNEDEPEKENRERHKPHPRRRSNLIAQWESLITAKKEASENGIENANTV